MAESVRVPLRNIPIETLVDSVEVSGRVLVLWPNDMTVAITSPVSGWATGVHVPAFAMCPQNWLATFEGGRTAELTDRGRRRAEDLLAELYNHSQGRGSGWRVYPLDHQADGRGEG
jgi:hypothetical protein